MINTIIAKQTPAKIVRTVQGYPSVLLYERGSVGGTYSRRSTEYGRNKCKSTLRSSQLLNDIRTHPPVGAGNLQCTRHDGCDSGASERGQREDGQSYTSLVGIPQIRDQLKRINRCLVKIDER